MLPTHICKLCVFVISLSAVGNFNCTENIFKITAIPVTLLSNNSHKRRIKLRYQKVNEVDPNSNQKNRICPFYLLLFFLLIIFPSPSSTTCYTIPLSIDQTKKCNSMWRWPSDMANCLCLTSNPLLKSSHLLMWKLCKRRYWTTANKIAAMIRRVWEEQQDCCIYRFYLLHSQGKAIYLHLIAERSIIENASNVCGSEAVQGQKMLKNQDLFDDEDEREKMRRWKML